MSKAYDWDSIRYDWEVNNMSYKAIAEKYKISVNTLKTKKRRNNWARKGITSINGEVSVVADSNNPSDVQMNKPADAKNYGVSAGNAVSPYKQIKEKQDSRDNIYTIDDYKEEIDTYKPSKQLTPNEQVFVIQYLKTRNQAKSYMQAYDRHDISVTYASNKGAALLAKPAIRNEVHRISNSIINGHLITPTDIIDKYVDIAFADIKDFIDFGTEEYEEVDEVTGETRTKIRNFVRFKDMDKVDGTLIQEIKLGRDGASIKLYDKFKAIESLAKYTQAMNTDKIRQLEERKLELQIQELEQRIQDSQNGTQQTTFIVTNEDAMRAALEKRKENIDDSTADSE